MKALNINNKIVDTYFELLKNLDSKAKLELINKLNLTLTSGVSKKKSSFNKAFGAWDKEEDAEKLILEIRNNRNFNRIIEAF
jgi:hypothetical protein